MIKNFHLSIVVCSVRPIQTSALLSSLIHQLSSQDQVIVIFDLLIESKMRNIFSKSQPAQIQFIYNQCNKGVSYCRNLGMHKAVNSFLIFFDDDVFLPQNTLKKYRYFFSQGLTMIGGL